MLKKAQAVIQKTSRKNVTSTVLILTCICLRDGGSICQGRDTFLNASLRILNAPLHKRQFYNSITTHQYKRFIRHQHESYNLGGYYAHPLLLIHAHPLLGINETTKTYTWSDVVPLTLRHRIKSHLLFAGIIRSSPFSLR